MAKRKERIQNPEPFVPDGTEYAKSKKSSKAAKKHQKDGELIDSHISSKIMKEALIQLKEVEDEEEAKEENVTRSSFQRIEEVPNAVEDGDGDIDDFSGFDEIQTKLYEMEFGDADENQSQFGDDDVSHIFSLILIFSFDEFVLCLYPSLVLLALLNN
jgi:essential nuclear protein 1